MTAGYSGTPLVTKLGIKPDDRVTLVGAPADFRRVIALEGDVRVTSSLRGRPAVVIVFVTAAAELARRRDALAEAIFPNGAVWVAWPKRASKVPTDMTEDVVREVFLPHGLVDNKVCAIDETWSGLRVVWRKELRHS
jgi:hypothetical protein